MKNQGKERAAWLALLEKYKYVLLVALVGILLLLWPGDKRGGEEKISQTTATAGFDLVETEQKLSKALSRVDGAGEVSVVLTVSSTSRQVIAQDDRTTLREGSSERAAETVVVSKGSGTQEPVLLEQLYPEYQGALIVCTGAEDPQVRLKLVEAVSALTGLGADKISICRGK